MDVVIAYDSVSFSAGQDCGARVAACVARGAALELTEHSHWWNRWKRRLMARALVACAEEMECAADDGTWQDSAATARRDRAVAPEPAAQGRVGPGHLAGLRLARS